MQSAISRRDLVPWSKLGQPSFTDSIKAINEKVIDRFFLIYRIIAPPECQTTVQ